MSHYMSCSLTPGCLLTVELFPQPAQFGNFVDLLKLQLVNAGVKLQSQYLPNGKLLPR